MRPGTYGIYKALVGYREDFEEHIREAAVVPVHIISLFLVFPSVLQK